MDLPAILSLTAAIIFALITIFVALREEKIKKILIDREKSQKQRFYESAILKEIQDRIGYSLDIEKVIDVITGSLENLFPYSTASSLVVKEKKLVFKTHIAKSISHAFINQVKNSMLASLNALLDKNLPQTIDESITGAVIDDSNTYSLSSFFHIPLIVNGQVNGLINISSTKPGLYKEEEMTILYQITNQASHALSRLQEVLTTEKGKLMAMIGSLADGVFMVDINNQLIVINSAASNLLKLEAKNPTLIEVFSALPREYDWAIKIETAMSKNSQIQEKEVRVGDKIVQVFITPVETVPRERDELDETRPKEVVGASVLLHDITLEKGLAQIKEDFTNMVVHELRAPLTAIRGASLLMASSEKKLAQEDQTKLLEIIGRQSRKLLDEVSSLLDAAKLESGRFTIQKVYADLDKIAQEKIALFQPQVEGKHITLTLHSQPDLPKTYFDIDRIGQVINNLISNSLKFTPEEGKITLNLNSNLKNLIISVSDTGIGIPKEKQGQLFSKFSQVNPTAPLYSKLKSLATAQAGSTYVGNLGTGLGLYVVKGIVEAHKGTIYLESEPGRGTTITFTLPLLFSEAPAGQSDKTASTITNQYPHH